MKLKHEFTKKNTRKRTKEQNPRTVTFRRFCFAVFTELGTDNERLLSAAN